MHYQCFLFFGIVNQPLIAHNRELIVFPYLLLHDEPMCEKKFQAAPARFG